MLGYLCINEMVILRAPQFLVHCRLYLNKQTEKTCKSYTSKNTFK